MLQRSAYYNVYRRISCRNVRTMCVLKYDMPILFDRTLKNICLVDRSQLLTLLEIADCMYVGRRRADRSTG